MVEENRTLKLIYRWYGRVSIVLLPAAIYGLYIAKAIEEGRQMVYYLKRIKDWTIINKYSYIIFKLNDAQGYLALVCNLTSCVIMVAILRLLR